MIYYLKYILIAFIIVAIESSLIFKSMFNLYITPDLFLVYIFWLSIYNKEDVVLITTLIGSLLLDLLMPFKSFINVIIYLSVAFTIFRLKEKFLISNIFMKFLIITGISFFIILIKELYGFMTLKFFILDTDLVIFYWLSNIVLIYLIYYLKEILETRYDKV
jgi:rod shape-determining protein MreD